MGKIITWNVIGKDNDMVITISGKTETECISEIETTIKNKRYYFEKLSEYEQP